MKNYVDIEIYIDDLSKFIEFLKINKYKFVLSLFFDRCIRGIVQAKKTNYIRITNINSKSLELIYNKLCEIYKKEYFFMKNED